MLNRGGSDSPEKLDKRKPFHDHGIKPPELTRSHQADGVNPVAGYFEPLQGWLILRGADALCQFAEF